MFNKKILLIIPLVAGLGIFAVGISGSQMANTDKIEDKKRALAMEMEPFFEKMLQVCDGDLTSAEVQTCLQDFDKVRTFCSDIDASFCGDKRMTQLEQKLSGV